MNKKEKILIAIRFMINELLIIIGYLFAGYAYAVNDFSFAIIFISTGFINYILCMLKVRKYNIVPFFFMFFPKERQEFWNTIEK